jgi:hypothetical protein
MAFRKLATLLLFFMLAITRAQAGAPIDGPNYAPVKEALRNYGSVMDKLATTVPTIDDSPSIANALNLFSQANEELSASLRDLLAKNPEIAKLKEPPPELAIMWNNLGQLHARYDATAHDLAIKARDHASDPQVREAMTRFANSAAGVAAIGQ